MSHYSLYGQVLAEIGAAAHAAALGSVRSTWDDRLHKHDALRIHGRYEMHRD